MGFVLCFLAAVATLDRGEGELPRHAANAQPAAEAADISRWLELWKLPDTFEFWKFPFS